MKCFVKKKSQIPLLGDKLQNDTTLKLARKNKHFYDLSSLQERNNYLLQKTVFFYGKDYKRIYPITIYAVSWDILGISKPPNNLLPIFPSATWDNPDIIVVGLQHIQQTELALWSQRLIAAVLLYNPHLKCICPSEQIIYSGTCGVALFARLTLFPYIQDIIVHHIKGQDDGVMCCLYVSQTPIIIFSMVSTPDMTLEDESIAHIVNHVYTFGTHPICDVLSRQIQLKQLLDRYLMNVRHVNKSNNPVIIFLGYKDPFNYFNHTTLSNRLNSMYSSSLLHQLPHMDIRMSHPCDYKILCQSVLPKRMILKAGILTLLLDVHKEHIILPVKQDVEMMLLRFYISQTHYQQFIPLYRSLSHQIKRHTVIEPTLLQIIPSSVTLSCVYPYTPYTFKLLIRNPNHRPAIFHMMCKSPVSQEPLYIPLNVCDLGHLDVPNHRIQTHNSMNLVHSKRCDSLNWSQLSTKLKINTDSALSCLNNKKINEDVINSVPNIIPLSLHPQSKASPGQIKHTHPLLQQQSYSSPLSTFMMPTTFQQCHQSKDPLFDQNQLYRAEDHLMITHNTENFSNGMSLNTQSPLLDFNNRSSELLSQMFSSTNSQDTSNLTPELNMLKWIHASPAQGAIMGHGRCEIIVTIHIQEKVPFFLKNKVYHLAIHWDEYQLYTECDLCLSIYPSFIGLSIAELALFGNIPIQLYSPIRPQHVKQYPIPKELWWLLSIIYNDTQQIHSTFCFLKFLISSSERYRSQNSNWDNEIQLMISFINQGCSLNLQLQCVSTAALFALETWASQLTTSLIPNKLNLYLLRDSTHEYCHNIFSHLSTIEKNVFVSIISCCRYLIKKELYHHHSHTLSSFVSQTSTKKEYEQCVLYLETYPHRNEYRLYVSSRVTYDSRVFLVDALQ